jgi:hypothetical protein
VVDGDICVREHSTTGRGAAFMWSGNGKEGLIYHSDCILWRYFSLGGHLIFVWLRGQRFGLGESKLLSFSLHECCGMFLHICDDVRTRGY